MNPILGIIGMLWLVAGLVSLMFITQAYPSWYYVKRDLLPNIHEVTISDIFALIMALPWFAVLTPIIYFGKLAAYVGELRPLKFLEKKRNS